MSQYVGFTRARRVSVFMAYLLILSALLATQSTVQAQESTTTDESTTLMTNATISTTNATISTTNATIPTTNATIPTTSATIPTTEQATDAPTTEPITNATTELITNAPTTESTTVSTPTPIPVPDTGIRIIASVSRNKTNRYALQISDIGLTMNLELSEGNITAYYSYTNPNPNESDHLGKLNLNEEITLYPSSLFIQQRINFIDNENDARIYIAVTGLRARNTYVLALHHGIITTSVAPTSTTISSSTTNLSNSVSMISFLATGIVLIYAFE